MLVKIWLYLTKAVITGDVDEVRVQSEEPYIEKPAFEQAFCFSALSETAPAIGRKMPPDATDRAGGSLKLSPRAPSVTARQERCLAEHTVRASGVRTVARRSRQP